MSNSRKYCTADCSLYVHMLTCGCVGTGDLNRRALVCWLMELFLFFTHNHTSSDAASPVSLLRALTGPRIPRVQLYYKAQDQEQERAAYFRKRVAPLLLHTHTPKNFNVVLTHFVLIRFQVCVFTVCTCVFVLKVYTANQGLFFPLIRLKCPYDVSVELASYCLQSK